MICRACSLQLLLISHHPSSSCMLAAFICTKKNVQFISVFALSCLLALPRKLLNFPWHVVGFSNFPAGCRARNSLFPRFGCKHDLFLCYLWLPSCSRRSPPTTLFQMSRLGGQRRISYFCPFDPRAHTKNPHTPPSILT